MDLSLLSLLITNSLVATTWTVDIGGSGDFTSVQDAVNASVSGDEILVSAGVYLESVDLSGKDLVVTGAGATQTSIGGPGFDHCLVAAAGETLTLSALALAGCDAFVEAAGAYLEFDDVHLWGALGGGTIDSSTFVWSEGALYYQQGAALAISDSVVEWDAVELTLNTTAGALVDFADCTTTLVDVVAAENVIQGWLDDATGVFFCDGGTLSVDGLVAHDNDSGDGGVLNLHSSVVADVVDSHFYANSSTYRGSSISSSTATFTTSNCLFEDADHSTVHAGGTVDYTSTNDTFDVSNAVDTGLAMYLQDGGTVVIDGTTFTGFNAGELALSLEHGGSATIRSISLDEGYLKSDRDTLIEDSVFMGEKALMLDNWYGTSHLITRCDFQGTGGSAVEADMTTVLDEVTMEGYDSALYLTGASVTIQGSSLSNIGTVLDAVSTNQLELVDSSVSTTGDAVSIVDGTIVIDNTTIETPSRGVELGADSEATLNGVVIDAGTVGIVSVSDAGFQATQVHVDAGTAVSIDQNPGAEPTVEIVESTLNGNGGDGVYVHGTVRPHLSIVDSDLTAAYRALHIEDQVASSPMIESCRLESGWDAVYVGWAGITLDDVEIVAGQDGFGGEPGVNGTDLTIVATGNCFSDTTRQINVEGLQAQCGEAGIAGSTNLTLSDALIQPVLECMTATEGVVLEGVTCDGGAGVYPMSFVTTSNVTMTDVLVTGCSTTYPSDVSVDQATFSNVRFIGNTASSGPGALSVIDTTLVGHQLYFEGNQGIDAGAMTIAGSSTAEVEASVFRSNVASAGPGAVHDEVGGTWTCCLFQENQGETGDLWVVGTDPYIQNSAFLGSNASVSGSLEIDATLATVANTIFAHAPSGVGLYADASVNTTWFLYNDLWDNAGGAYGGGMADLTGTNGNIEADPMFIAYSPDGDFTNDDLRLDASSPCVDTGYPAWTDDDGTQSDMGVYGVHCADLIDFDGDGQLVFDGDCDDTNADVWLGAPEVCDGLDNDCDGVVPADEADDDGDGSLACGADCDDADPGVHPGAAEDCLDGVDNDCNGLVDTDDPACAGDDDDTGDDDTAVDDDDTVADDDDTAVDDDDTAGDDDTGGPDDDTADDDDTAGDDDATGDDDVTDDDDDDSTPPDNDDGGPPTCRLVHAQEQAPLAGALLVPALLTILVRRRL